LATVSGIRVTVPSIAPTRSPPPTSIPIGPPSRCSAVTAPSSSRCNCSRAAGPTAARHLDKTVEEGTACARCHGTPTRSPSSVVSTSRASASGIKLISSTARIVNATLIWRCLVAVTFPPRRTPAATRSIVPGPQRRSNSASTPPNRA